VGVEAKKNRDFLLKNYYREQKYSVLLKEWKKIRKKIIFLDKKAKTTHQKNNCSHLTLQIPKKIIFFSKKIRI